MTSIRWQHKIVEVPVKLFAGALSARAQVELDKLGPLGWELVSAVQSHSADTLRLFLKKPA